MHHHNSGLKHQLTNCKPTTHLHSQSASQKVARKSYCIMGSRKPPFALLEEVSYPNKLTHTTPSSHNIMHLSAIASRMRVIGDLSLSSSFLQCISSTQGNPRILTSPLTYHSIPPYPMRNRKWKDSKLFTAFEVHQNADERDAKAAWKFLTTPVVSRFSSACQPQLTTEARMSIPYNYKLLYIVLFKCCARIAN